MTYTISSIDEYQQSFALHSVETRQEASDLLEEIDIALGEVSGLRYHQLLDQYHSLREQLMR
ncbi:hypothetical protein N9997_01560 [Synechococcus sp. AH-603-L18]|nr:hypothetical protein [Synechococcus sp. AH-603-L18]MDB4338010.1 hypothetical protein [Synechococcus sp. AH-603-L18]